jgi:hypothetical protein
MAGGHRWVELAARADCRALDRRRRRPGDGFVAQNVLVGIETDRGMSAMVAAGYQVF